jgi:hypothetical protein
LIHLHPVCFPPAFFYGHEFGLHRRRAPTPYRPARRSCGFGLIDRVRHFSRQAEAADVARNCLNGTRGVRIDFRRMAAGANANAKLTFNLDHSVGADQRTRHSIARWNAPLVNK